MLQKLLFLIAKLFLGKGIDRKFPFLVDLYKKIYAGTAPNQEVRVRIPLNSRLLISTKNPRLGLSLRTSGEFEAKQTKLFLKAVKPGDIVFDIGANVGYYTVLASKKVGRRGKVFAFEPDPHNLTFLQKNQQINNCQNVEIIEKAVADKDGKSYFLQDTSNPGESRLSNKGEITVETITLDTFISQKKIKKVDVIKIDIEGAEIQALKGGREFLKNSKNIKIFIECNQTKLKESKKTVDELIKKILSLKFEIKEIINESERKIYPFTELELHKNLQRVCVVNLYAQKNYE